MEGHKKLLTYKLSQISFDITWDFIPQYYNLREEGRQRDQSKQAARSHKQNIVEGSSERSLSSKLKLYDVSRSSSQELLEDYEDILRLENLSRWNKNDSRLIKIRRIIENYPSNLSAPSCPSVPPKPSVSSVLEAAGLKGKRRIRRGEGQKEVEIIANYMIDLLTRCNYLLDCQINAVEEKHRTEGGYNENLLKKRLDYKKQNS